jgi:hypothetical protein
MGDACCPNMSTLSESDCWRDRQSLFHHHVPMVSACPAVDKHCFDIVPDYGIQDMAAASTPKAN